MTKEHTAKEYLPKEKRQTSFQTRKGKKYEENTIRTEKICYGPSLEDCFGWNHGPAHWPWM